MITVAIFIIGVLFILNGITSMANAKVVANVRAQMPKGCEIYTGTAKGLFCLSSYDAMIAVLGNGKIQKAFCIRRGWMRKSLPSELLFNNCKMEQINQNVEGFKPMEQRACAMALHQYTRRRK